MPVYRRGDCCAGGASVRVGCPLLPGWVRLQHHLCLWPRQQRRRGIAAKTKARPAELTKGIRLIHAGGANNRAGTKKPGSERPPAPFPRWASRRVPPPPPQQLRGRRRRSPPVSKAKPPLLLAAAGGCARRRTVAARHGARCRPPPPPGAAAPGAACRAAVAARRKLMHGAARRACSSMDAAAAVRSMQTAAGGGTTASPPGASSLLAVRRCSRQQPGARQEQQQRVENGEKKWIWMRNTELAGGSCTGDTSRRRGNNQSCFTAVRHFLWWLPPTVTSAHAGGR